MNPAGVLITGDLEIAISNGSGLYMGLPTPEPDSVGHVVVTRANKERVVRIARSHDRTGPLRVAAFVSTYDTVSTLRRRVSPINDAPVIVRWYQQPSDVEYWPIGPRQSGELVVEGPTNILLDTIVALSEELQETHSGYRIYAHFGDDAPDLIEFAIGLSSRRAFIDGLERVLGRRRATRIAVPAGRHRLVLHADAEVYARVSVFTPDNYLLPVNIPSHVAPEAALAPGSHWDLTENDIENWAHGTIEQRERVALRLARDNQRRGGGLLAANLLEQTALAFPHNTRLANLATAFAQRYTMHRQLLPRSRDAPITHRFHWLASPERFARIAELVGRNPKNRRLALASLENAHFFDFDPDAELVFAIPPRGGDSTLRLAAAVTANRTPQMFQVQFDDGSPAIPVYLPADAALRSDVPTDTEPHDRLDDDAVAELTLLPPFASHNRPARLVKAASVEIPLPVKARTVTLKATSGRLHVTAQYRVSRRFALTETEHDAALRRTGPYGSFEQLKRLFDQAARPTGYVVQVGAFADADNGEALLNQLVTLNYPAQQKIKDDRDGRLVLISLGPYPTRDAARAALQTLNAEPSVAVGPLTDAQVTKLTRFADNDLDGDLASHRAPLVRWLRSRHTSFRNRTAATHGRTVDDARRGIDTERMAEEARRLEHNGAWQLALERWRQINGSASRQLREVAVRGQYQALMRLNEPRLAEAYLRDVFQHDDDPVIRDLAFAMLSEHYTNEDNRSSQEMFLAAAALRDPGVAEMHRLIDNLLESGRAKDALTLALAMPPWDRPLGAIVEASYEVGWWDTFGAAVAKLDDEEQRHWWRGYRTQARGEFDAARELWNRAGTRG
ncbi:MAG: SPOR domain-containing protein, partial [Alphaproteobacteria bacterium]|nr:SPOR domain-containing protein [Alphaproteobacteria bacterium]